MKLAKRNFRFPISVLIGSTPLNILRVIKDYRIDIRYYPKFLLTFLISINFKGFNLFERLIEKKRIKSLQTSEPPIFIIGFWRSGTTILHSLLCQDPLAGYVTTFHGVFPNLVLTQQKWLKPLADIIMPRERPFDGYSMDLDFPQEEDIAMLSLQEKGFYKILYFPKDSNKILREELFFEQFPYEQRKQWETKYLSMINKAMLNTGGIRYVSKNPCNIFRIKTLTKLFPDGRFIFIYRNPYSVVESLYRFVDEVLPGSELQHCDGGIPREFFAQLYKNALQEYMNVRETIKPVNLMEIRYEEFKEHPIGTIHEIYNNFNLPGFNVVKPGMESYLEKNRPDTRQPYKNDPEIYRLVNFYAGDIVNKLGYQLIDHSL